MAEKFCFGVLVGVLLLAGGVGAQDLTRSEVLTQGVVYESYVTAQPNRIHVLRMDRSNPELMLHMGFPQGRRNFTQRQTVRGIAGVYDSPGFDVVGAVNGSFFFDGIGIHDALGSENVAIQGPGGTRETFMLSDARVPRIVNRLQTHSKQLRFADGSVMDLDFWNETRHADSVALYTPIWGASTRTTFDGVEVLLRGVNHPARGDKWVSGVVVEIRSGAGARDSGIPADGMVLSARDGKAVTLLSKVSVGDRLEARIDINHRGVSSAALMITGRGWLLSGGEINTANWTAHASHRDVRHPRTVVAWSESEIFLVAIDGRQAGFSVGMNFMEMAFFLRNTLGATDAVNLDGGGSTTLVANGTVRNSPSDGWERAVANSLMIVRRNKGFVPVSDRFTAEGRELDWDEIFRFNPVVPFEVVSPGGDGYVLHLKPEQEIYESASVGNVWDRNYAVEADVYCDYRSENLVGNETGGIFARDDGAGKWEYKSFNGGNAYVMQYSSVYGAIRMGKVVNGVFERLLPNLTQMSNEWRNFRIECEGDQVRFYLDGMLQGRVTDTTHKAGRAGMGVWETFTDDANVRGFYFDNFRTVPLPYSVVEDWAIY